MITCNWPDFTKRTAGTENSSLLSSQAIQFNCPVANWDRRQLAPNRHPRPQMRRAKVFSLSPHSSLLSPRLWAPSGGSGPLRRACAPFAAKAAQGWRSPLRRRRQGLAKNWAVGPSALPCAGGHPPQRPPQNPTANTPRHRRTGLRPPSPIPHSSRAPPRPPQTKKGVKVFSVPLRGPPWIKGVKVFFVPLRGPPWIKRC